MTTENGEFVLGEDITTLARARSRGGTTVLSVRLSLDEFAAVESISRATGKTLSQVVREAINDWLRLNRYAEPSVTVYIGGTTTSVGVWEQRGQAVVVEPETPEDLPRTSVAVA